MKIETKDQNSFSNTVCKTIMLIRVKYFSIRGQLFFRLSGVLKLSEQG